MKGRKKTKKHNWSLLRVPLRTSSKSLDLSESYTSKLISSFIVTSRFCFDSCALQKQDIDLANVSCSVCKRSFKLRLDTAHGWKFPVCMPIEKCWAVLSYLPVWWTAVWSSLTCRRSLTDCCWGWLRQTVSVMMSQIWPFAILIVAVAMAALYLLWL